ncbi:hypothetical protein DL93DRAFT_787937 [Clavulina sp. PMI_390]|nr:hypothetical protein DL93DRAFT_787937 [Clavulina sp. PMI_390]
MMIALFRGQSLAKNDTLRESNIQLAKASLLTALALIISAIVQSHKYGLSVFDALILLNLCWIAVVGGFTPILSALMSPDHLDRLAHHWSSRPDSLGAVLRRIWSTFFDLPPTLEWLYLLYSNFILMSGFALWLMHNPSAFDHSLNPCTSTTVFWILGRLVNVTSAGFRAALITLYSLFLVPGVNILIVLVIWAMIYLPSCVLIWPLLWTLLWFWDNVIHPCLPHPGALNPRSERIFAGLDMLRPLPFVIANSILIVITRKTIHANIIDLEGQEWRLGQIFALVIAIFPALSVLRQLKG